ncbi:MAG: hypothetical protein RLN88_07585 [Ekhidna sp.]|uniref:hypothetical protein n=1 Tax=Ekhidna sp. TaxID=2608089 RepID=UPI0032EE68A3
MKRLHLFEFGDQKWFPDFLRDYETDFLQFLANKTKMYEPVIPLLDDLIQRSNARQIIDLGSGGGGGLLRINKELRKTYPDLKIILTDLYPNYKAFEYSKSRADNIDSIDVPVDARKMSYELKGIRTLFLSLHHFKEEDAITILQNAVTSDQPIAIFEAQERSFSSLLAMFLSPVTVLLTTPFFRPFKVGRIIFTYLIPIVPLVVWWDGIVSVLRTYSINEMDKMLLHVKNSYLYDWGIGKIKSGPGVIIYLIGVSKTRQ